MKFLPLLLLVLISPAHAAWKVTGATPAEKARLEKATAILAGTPTGKQVLADLAAFEISLEVDPSNESNGTYDDEYKVLTIARQALAKWPDWKLARLLCHELTHAVQDSLGINRANYDNAEKPVSSSGVTEFSALSKEVQFWVEIGAPVEGKDFNMLRMQAYLFFPETVRIGWAYTNDVQRFKEPVAAWADARLADYWTRVLAEEQAWRARLKPKFPAQYAAPAIALAYLKDRFAKPVSSWLPAYLENPQGAPPARPTANDAELLALHRLLPGKP